MMYNKIIAIMAYQSPELLKNCFESLLNCTNINSYQIIIHLDGLDLSDKTNKEKIKNRTLILEYIKHYKEKINILETIEQKKNLGCWNSKLFILNKAFELSDFPILVEEDNMLYKNALIFFETIYSNFHDLNFFWTASAYSSYFNYEEDLFYKTAPQIEDINKICVRTWPFSHVWAIRKTIFKKYCLSWNGYCQHLGNLLIQNKGIEFFPFISLSEHTGKYSYVHKIDVSKSVGNHIYNPDNLKFELSTKEFEYLKTTSIPELSEESDRLYSFYLPSKFQSNELNIICDFSINLAMIEFINDTKNINKTINYIDNANESFWIKNIFKKNNSPKYLLFIKNENLKLKLINKLKQFPQIQYLLIESEMKIESHKKNILDFIN